MGRSAGVEGGGGGCVWRTSSVKVPSRRQHRTRRGRGRRVFARAVHGRDPRCPPDRPPCQRCRGPLSRTPDATSNFMRVQYYSKKHLAKTKKGANSSQWTCDVDRCAVTFVTRAKIEGRSQHNAQRRARHTNSQSDKTRESHRMPHLQYEYGALRAISAYCTACTPSRGAGASAQRRP